MSRLTFFTILYFVCCPFTITASNSNINNVTLYKSIYDQYQQFQQNIFNRNISTLNLDRSNHCVKEILAVLNGLNPFNTQLWALKMFDATGKLEPGILEGNLYSLGSYDECLSIRNEQVAYLDKEILSISGKYCVIHLAGNNTENHLRGALGSNGLLSWGTCTPSGCSAEDLNNILGIINFPLRYNEVHCQVYEDKVELSIGDIITIVFLALISLITLLSTGYDYHIRQDLEKYKNTKASDIWLSFSLISNGEKLFSTKTNRDHLQCLSGIRTITMMWIVYFHMVNFTGMTKPISNLIHNLNLFKDEWTMITRGGTVSVDSFFVMSGIVLMYVHMNTIKLEKSNFNILLFYLHRYLRLTPAFAVVILIHVTLLRHFGSGPLWPYMDEFLIRQCRENWWTDLLYIQNYLSISNMCLNQTWFLAVDTQLHLFAPLILIPLIHWRKQTIAMVIVATLASVSSSFAMAYTMELHITNSKPGTLTPKMNNDYMYYYYYATYNRAHSWLIGILAGYCIYRVKMEKKIINLKLVVNIALWICSLAVLSTCVFYDLAQDDYNKIAQSFYIAFMRPAWCVALSWIVFACVTGNGGIANWFLSLPIFQVLARFTYSTYLVHLSIIVAIYLGQKSTSVVSNVSTIYEFWSVYMLCLGVGIIFTMLFESPIITLEKGIKSLKQNSN